MTIYRAVDDRQRGAVELTAAWMSENDQTLIAGKPSFNEQVPVKLSFLKRLVFGDRYGYLDDFLLSGGVLFVTHPAYSQTCAEKVRVYDVHSCALDLSVKKSLWPSQRWGTADTGKALYFSGADGLIYIVVAGGSPPDTEVEDYRDFKVDLTSLIEAAISPFAESKKKKVKSALTPYDSTSFPPFGTSVPGAYTPLPPSFYPDPQNPGQVIHTEGKIGGVFIDDQILRNAELGYRLVNHGEPRLFRLTANNASDIIKNATIGHNGFQRRLSTQLARDRFKPHMVLKVDGPVLHQSQLLNMASRGQKYGGETLTEQDILLEQWVTARPTHRIDISISSAVPTGFDLIHEVEYDTDIPLYQVIDGKLQRVQIRTVGELDEAEVIGPMIGSFRSHAVSNAAHDSRRLKLTSRVLQPTLYSLVVDPKVIPAALGRFCPYKIFPIKITQHPKGEGKNEPIKHV